MTSRRIRESSPSAVDAKSQIQAAINVILLCSSTPLAALPLTRGTGGKVHTGLGFCARQTTFLDKYRIAGVIFQVHLSSTYTQRP